MLTVHDLGEQTLDIIYYEQNQKKLTTASSHPANIYLFKVNNRSIGKRCGIWLMGM